MGEEIGTIPDRDAEAEFGGEKLFFLIYERHNPRGDVGEPYRRPSYLTKPSDCVSYLRPVILLPCKLSEVRSRVRAEYFLKTIRTPIRCPAQRDKTDSDHRGHKYLTEFFESKTVRPVNSNVSDFEINPSLRHAQRHPLMACEIMLFCRTIMF